MKFSVINRRTVKLIALLTMLIDHIGSRLTTLHPEMFDSILMLRSIGRIAFPLFAFQMGLTFQKTKSLPKLVLNLFWLALISEIPFDLMVSSTYYDVTHQNVIWNFFLVGLALLISKWLANRFEKINREVILIFLSLSFGLLSEHFMVDYGLMGFIITFIFTRSHKREIKALLPLTLFEFWWVKNSLFISSLLISFYDDRAVSFKRWEGFCYHYFYPIHLILIYWFMQ